jgi:hypothetical protein
VHFNSPLLSLCYKISCFHHLLFNGLKSKPSQNSPSPRRHRVEDTLLAQSKFNLHPYERLLLLLNGLFTAYQSSEISCRRITYELRTSFFAFLRTMTGWASTSQRTFRFTFAFTLPCAVYAVALNNSSTNDSQPSSVESHDSTSL